jgi:uncharacterized protein (TIGR03000 family)
MFSMVLMVALSPAVELPACPRRLIVPIHYHCPSPIIVVPAPPAEEDAVTEEEAPEGTAPTAAEMKKLDELLQLIADAAERAKVKEYWNNPAVTSAERAEYYRDLKKQAGDEDTTEEEAQGEVTTAVATLVVELSASARLLIDGKPTQATSGRRVFVTPPLPTDKSGAYELEMRVVRDGQTVIVRKKAPVRGGQTTTVRLD